MFDVEVNRHFILVLLDQFENGLFVQLSRLQDIHCLLIPIFHQGVSVGVDLFQQGVDSLLALFPLGMVCPVVHQDLVQSLLVLLQFMLNLLSPYH